MVLHRYIYIAAIAIQAIYVCVLYPEDKLKTGDGYTDTEFDGARKAHQEYIRAGANLADDLHNNRALDMGPLISELEGEYAGGGVNGIDFAIGNQILRNGVFVLICKKVLYNLECRCLRMN